MDMEDRDGITERRVLIWCITSAVFLARSVSKVGKEPFRSRLSNTIWRICDKHYRKYSVAPGRDIESLLADEIKDTNTQKVLDRLLAGLSEEYERQEPLNLSLALDVAQKHWNGVLLEKLQEDLRNGLATDVEGSVTRVNSFLPINLQTPPVVDVSLDGGMQTALEEKTNVLIRLPGAAGQFFGEELAEDSFVAFIAAAKGSKSWWLLHLAYLAWKQHRHVAYFQVGDLSEKQFKRRLLKRICYRPLWAKTIHYPTGIVLPAGYRELAAVDKEERVYEKDIPWKTVQNKLDKVTKASKGSFRLSYHPVNTVSVKDIKNILEEWAREGHHCEVVVIDYANNLAPIDWKMDPIRQVSYTWAMLRQLSEIRKCLVVTAQQSNKEGFSAYVLTRKNFSDSKMILAHVTAMLGINRTDEEVGREITRLNFVARREDMFQETHCLYCAGALDVGNPCVVSCLPERRR